MDGKKGIGRSHAFDLYRALAASSVVVLHFVLLNETAIPRFLWYLLVGINIYGVPVFFTISGYLLTASYSGIDKKNPSKLKLCALFWLKRLLRIYPPYVVALILIWWWKNDQDVFNLWIHLCNLHNFFVAYSRSINVVFWSLAVEFQWYLLAPFLIPIVLRKKHSILGVLLLILASLIWRNFYTYQFVHEAISVDEFPLLAYDQLIIHLFSFVLGICLYKAELRIKLSGRLLILILWVLGVLQAYLFGFIKQPQYPLQLFILGNMYYVTQPLIALLIGYYRSIVFKPGLILHIVAFVANISYSMYLWHWPILEWLKLHQLSFFSELAAYLVLVVLVSTVSYYCVEQWGMSANLAWLRAKCPEKQI